MKKIMLMCCFLLGISAVSFAQGRQQRSPEEQAKQLKEQLKLTDDQTAKLTAIYQTQAKTRDSIRTAANGDMQSMRQAMMPLMQSTNAKIQAILTPEQKTAYDKMVAERMERMRQGGGGAPPSQK